MKTFKKTYRGIKAVFRSIYRKIEKIIVVPITKFIIMMSEKTGKNGRSFERWLTRKSTLVFVSLLLAFIFFFLIDSKSITLVDSSAEVLYNQKVHAIYNAEAYVIEGLPEEVDVVLIGRSSDLYLAKQLSTKDVTVDLSGLKPGMHKVDLKYENDVRTISYKLDPSTANIYIYPKLSETRTVNIDLLNKDKLHQKLAIKDVNIDQSEIIIKGADHTLAEVSTVKALVDINNLTDTSVGVKTIKDVNLVAYDKLGRVVPVEMVPSKVTATVSIVSPNKEVPLKIIPIGNPQFGKAISSLVANVSKVVVYGEEDVINSIQFIPVEVDVTNLKEDKEFTIILTKPSGIRYISETTVKVKVSLSNEVTKEINDVPIVYENLDSNYRINAIDGESSKTTIVVKGTKEIIDNIDISTIKASIDLSGYGVGDHEVSVTVTGDEVKATYTSKTTKIKIRIANK